MASVASSGAKPSPSPPIQIPPSATLLSGATSGLVSCILLQPLDLLKTRLQQANSRTAPLGTKTQRLANTIQNVVAQDGIKGLWRGTWPTILRNVPGVALYFYSVTELRRQLATQPVKYLSVAQSSPTATANTPAKPTSTGNLLAGAFARVTVGFILCPITVVKARFESSNFSPSQNSTLLLSLRSIYAESGLVGLFRGFTATALRDAPYAGLYLMFYEKGKSLLASHTDDEWKARVVSGLAAGTLATLLTHPFDILKTRLQTQAIPVTATGTTTTTAAAVVGIRQTLVEIHRQGPSSLFLDGLGLRCARKAASSAIGWGIFEGGRDLWVRRQIARQESANGEIAVQS